MIIIIAISRPQGGRDLDSAAGAAPAEGEVPYYDYYFDYYY